MIGAKLAENVRKHPEIHKLATSENTPVHFTEISLEFVHCKCQHLDCRKATGVTM